jgi:endoplasmic reticulum Man9GlcNAc2 1,2-alpha-mannosidase
MNIPDPFSLRRNAALDVLRVTAAQAALGIRDQAVAGGAHALQKGIQTLEDMAFTVPRNVPSFSNPQRHVEDHLWSSSGVSARGAPRANGLLDNVQGRVGNFLDPNRNGLPMYKDKPYPHSQRRRPLYRRKRVVALVLLGIIGILYYFGFLGDHQEFGASVRSWTWLRKGEKGKKVDWLKRRERVVEAFELSWDAYERYAWGRCFTVVKRCRTDADKLGHQVTMSTIPWRRPAR